MSTIYILWLRQLKRHLRSRGRVLSSLGQPLLFLVAFGFGFSGVFRRAGAGNYLQFLAPGVIGMGIGFRPQLLSTLPLLLLYMVLIAVMFTALGTSIACIVADFQAFPLVMNFLVMPLFFLSGALFPLDQVPRALKMIAAVNPLSYGIDGVRGALTGAWHFSPGADVAVLVVLTVALLMLGTRLFGRIEA